MNKQPLEVDCSTLPDWQQKEPWAHVQAWFNSNAPGEKMIYKDAATRQICFFRDIFFEMFPEGVEVVEVIGTHTSKSIKLPVYHILLKNGIDFVIRDNFHDVKVSVDSPYELEFPTLLFFRPDLQISHHYCEGFDQSWIYGPYTASNKRFTVEICDKRYFHVFAFLLRVQLNSLSKEMTPS